MIQKHLAKRKIGEIKMSITDKQFRDLTVKESIMIVGAAVVVAYMIISAITGQHIDTSIIMTFINKTVGM